VEIYKIFIEWTLEIQRVYVDEEFMRAINLLSRLTENIITEFEGYIFGAYEKVDNTFSVDTDNRVLDLSISLTAPDEVSAQLTQEISRVFG